jgi:signal-transduction protein with cAMP-binding, CBS, and nucleotidyltransferase domain
MAQQKEETFDAISTTTEINIRRRVKHEEKAMYSFIKANQIVAILTQHVLVQIYHPQEVHVPRLKSATNVIAATCSTICSWF